MPRILFLLLLMGLATASTAVAQRFNRVEDTQSNVSSYFYYVQPGDATVQVYVVGTVQAPGLYIVREGTHLGELLALTGGPVLPSRMKRDERRVTIRLFRSGQGDGPPAFEATLDKAVTSPTPYPVLREGDVMTVEVVESQRFSWRDAFTILGGVSAIAVAVERLVNISSR